MSDHKASSSYEGGIFAFSCACGVAFKVGVRAYQVAGVERVAGGDPRECERAASALEATGLSSWDRADALTQVAAHSMPPKKITRVARAFSDEVTAAAVALLGTYETPNAVVHASGLPKAGGGRVSRPPQSAPTSGNLSSPLGVSWASNRLCLTPPSPTDPNATRTIQDENGSPAAASDAPDGQPSLTHETKHATKRPDPILLANNVDTLEVSWFDVEMTPAELVRLESHKKKVQEMPADGPDSRFAFGGESWQMKPTGGRRHQFILVHERGELAISKCPSKTVPALRFKLYSETLWSLTLEGTWSWMKAIVDKVHAPEGASEESDEQPKVPRPSLSRVDLAADFLGFPLQDVELEEFVCRPRHKSKWKKLDEGWRRVPLGHEKADESCAKFLSGLRTTGLSFGRGSLSMRIYDKVQEIKDQSPDKVWLYGFWMRCTACGARANEHEAVMRPGPEITKEPVVGYAGCERTSCAAFVVDLAGFVPERECAECEGTGQVSARVKCRECKNGRRKKITCETCNRTGEQEAKRKCGGCRGKKIVPDRAIRVEAQYRREALTEFCKGVERTCAKCSGLGEIAKPGRPCKRCDGKGAWSCLLCDGTGQKKRGPCGGCEGTGRRTCRKCGGKGSRHARTVVCKRCQAAEAAPTDKGRGQRTEKPDPREVADPRAGLVVDTPKRGARNVGEDLELLVDTLEGLKAARGALWRYVVGGGQGVRAWLAWRTPQENPQRTRWPLRSEWAAVQRAPDWSSGPARDELVRVQRKRAKFKKILPGLLGYMSTAVALVRDRDDVELQSFEAAMELVYDECGELLAEREEKKPTAGWACVVQEKQELYGRWGLLGDMEMAREREAELAVA